MDDWDEMLKGMARALGHEMADVQRRDLGRTWHLYGGRKLEHPHRGGLLYRFRMDGRRAPRLGEKGLLRVRGSDAPATVKRLEGAQLTFAVRQDLGDVTEEGCFVVRDDALLSHLLDRLRAYSRVVQPESLAHRFAAGGASRRLPLRGGPDRADVQRLNPRQASAVHAALTHDLNFLWGPPGTGKTATSAAVARAWVRRGQSVLLMAPTNRAVDRLLAAVLSHDALSELVERGEVLRVGAMDDPRIEAILGPRVALSEVVSRMAVPIHARAREVLEEAGALRLLRSEGAVELAAREAELSRQARVLDAELRHLPRTLIDGARVIATTVHRAALDWLGRGFDAGVLDEASMISLPWATAALLPVRERIIAAGDPHQLGPVVRSRSQAARTWLGRSPMDSLEPGDAEPTRVLLTEQYRMHSVLCQVVSRLSYRNALMTAPSVDRRGLTVGLPGPLLYLDTQRFEPRCVRARGSGSRSNPIQATIVADLVERFRPMLAERRIAVITPYTAQAALIRREIRTRSVPGLLDVGTVHALQGDGTALVILDLTDAPGLPLGHFMRAGEARDPGGRLLTVAVSRAEHHLIVVGDLSWLAEAARSVCQRPREGVLLRFLRLLAELGEPLEVSSGARDHLPTLGRSPKNRRRGIHS